MTTRSDDSAEHENHTESGNTASGKTPHTAGSSDRSSDSTSNTDTGTTASHINLRRTLADLDLLLTYLGKNGKSIPTELISTLVACKHYGPVENWTQKQETQFWLALNAITAHIKPVTLSSLKTFSPQLADTSNPASSQRASQRKKSSINRAIIQYGIITSVTIFLIIGLQTYHLVGQDVLMKSQELFNIRNKVRGNIKRTEVAAKKIAEALTPPSDSAGNPAYNEKKSGYIDENITYETPCDALEHSTPFQKKYTEILSKDEDYQVLKERDKLLDQEFDANRTIMFQWNLIWRGGHPPTPVLSIYDQNRYNSQISRLTHLLLAKTGSQEFSDCDSCIAQQVLPTQHANKPLVETPLCPQTCNLDIIAQSLLAKDYNRNANNNAKLCQDISNIKTQLAKVTVQKSLHQSRDIYFRSLLNATFMLNLLNNYLLPMLYGCLGALSLVLRSLCKSIKEETFTSYYALDYNMRIVLGTVSGMAAGLFLGAESPLGEGSFSLMLFSFVLGYNVDVLFKLVDNITSKIIPERAHSPPSSEHKPT